MIIKDCRKALLLGAAFFAWSQAASAQEVRDLDDATSDVRIFTGDVGNAPVRFSYTIPAATVLVVDAVPTQDSGLDPLLTVTDAASGEVLVEDDDGGEGLGARARIVSEEGRRIEIEVSSFGFFTEDATSGPFELQLRSSPYAPVPARSLAFGDSASGTLAPEDRHMFTIEGDKGQLLEVALVAGDEELDPQLSLYQGTDTDAEPLAINDDGGDGLNALLRYVLPESGTYTIVAAPFGETEGLYALRVAEASYPELQVPEQVLGLGERASGRLGEGYEFGSIDPAAITYQLTPEAIAAIRAGASQVTVNMTKPLFEDEDFASGADPFLELGFVTPLGLAVVLSDDDGGGDLAARIAIDLGSIASDGDWLDRLRIRATSISDGGPFEIELVEGMQEVAAPAGDGYPVEEAE